MMKEYQGQEFQEVIGVQGLVLVDFFATWCGPCQMIMPVLDQLAGEMTDVQFYKVDVDKHRSQAVEYQVQGVPTLVLFKDGEVVARASGYRPKAKIAEWINSFK
ncbi:MAG: thioredoxin [Acholeplasmataceae bacterium]|nr:thioredoxin [Acholeplasmataceae bacterium]